MGDQIALIEIYESGHGREAVKHVRGRRGNKQRRFHPSFARGFDSRGDPSPVFCSFLRNEQRDCCFSSSLRSYNLQEKRKRKNEKKERNTWFHVQCVSGKIRRNYHDRSRNVTAPPAYYRCRIKAIKNVRAWPCTRARAETARFRPGER